MHLKKKEKRMKQLILPTLLTALLATPVFAAGEHSGGHGHENNETHGPAGHHDEIAIGEPGKTNLVTKTISISMTETDDGQMLFEPSTINVKQGETVRLAFLNKGDAEHEFVMDEHPAILEHKLAMEKWPDMEHADPNSIRLTSGQIGEIIWTFNNSGNFEFACLIPGHFEAGMHGKLTVTKDIASN